MYRGWVKIHRQLWDNPVVTQDPEYLAVWIYLLTNATHKTYPVMFNGKKIFLEPGQLVTGRKKIAKTTKVNQSKVNRILKMLKIEQQIEQQATRHGSLITILNWHKYQDFEQPIEQQVNNNRTTTEQQVNTIQEYKEYKRMFNHKNMAEGDDEYWATLSPEAKSRWERIRAKNDKYMKEVLKGE